MSLPPVLPYGPVGTVPNLHALANAIRQLDARVSTIIRLLEQNDYVHTPDSTAPTNGVRDALRNGEFL